MKKFLVILLTLCMVLSLASCNKKSDNKDKKESKTKKATSRTLEEVLPLSYMEDAKPDEYSKKILAAGSKTESAEDLSKKYDFFTKKEFSLLNKFGRNLTDISVCCAVEKVTCCYLNYNAQKEWKDAIEFKKGWTTMIKGLPKEFYTLINDEDIPFDTKLKKLDRYGYLAYPFIKHLYNYSLYEPEANSIVSGYHLTYTLSTEEDKLLTKYFESYTLTDDQILCLYDYMSSIIKFSVELQL